MKNGSISYIELALTVLEDTLDFYRDIFDWKIEESFISNHRYFMFETPNGFTGGFDSLIKPSSNGPQVYIQVDDIDKTLINIEELFAGAVILKDTTLISEDYGFYALVLDPSGNKIGLQSNYRP